MIAVLQKKKESTLTGYLTGYRYLLINRIDI